MGEARQAYDEALSIYKLCSARSEAVPGRDSEAEYPGSGTREVTFHSDADRPALLRVEDRDDGVRGLSQLAVANAARHVECDSGIGSEQPIRPDATGSIQAARLEIGRVERNRVLVEIGLAGNLAQ